MVKKLRLRYAALALVITLIIFSMGGLLGYILSAEKSRVLLEEVAETRNEMENLQTELLYIQVLGTEHACPMFKKQVKTTSEELYLMGKQLVAYQDAKDFGVGFEQLKNEYMFLQIRTWLIYNKLREDCGSDDVDVLFFYSSGSCDGCIGQGRILDVLKAELGDRFLVFAVDGIWEQPIMDYMKNDFGVTELPALVISGKTYGFITEQELRGVLCSEYAEKPDFC